MKMVSSRKKIKNVNSLIACLLILFGFSFFINRAEAATTGTLVVTIQGDVKSGVTVEVSGGDLTTTLEKRTSSAGTVTFKGIVPGDYTVTPTKTDYKFSPQSKNVTILAGKTKRIKMTADKLDAKVGMAYCVSCHKNITPDVYADWLEGPHGNFEYVDASHHQYVYSDFTSAFTYPGDYTKFTGFPNEETMKESLTAPDMKGKKLSYCQGCHGMSSKDNKKVSTFPLVRADGSVDDINASKQVGRPIIGCEACHGSGRTHISRPKKDLAFNDPSPVQCGKCHSNKFPEGHLTYHPAGAAGVDNPGIYEAYSASAHPNSISMDSIYTDSKKKTVKALCSKCHTDQGARLYKDVDGDATTLPLELANEAGHKEFAAVQCRTCHNAHNPSKLLESASAATSTATARSAEFNTCTNCHQLLNSSDGKIAPFHSDHANSITKTHYDDPTTGPVGSTGGPIEGYNVSRGSDTACSNCHNPHVAGTEINKQWAESAHGDLAGEAWMHYEWKITSRADCQRCHTATGFANIVNNQDTYNPANNNFSHLSGKQAEVLYCNGCHTTDGSFARRKIGAYGGYVKFPSGDKVKMEDDSNLCLFCHGGRSSSPTVDGEIATAAGKAMSSTNIHYLAAAASFFGTDARGIYQYAGKTYVTRSTFPGHQGDKNTCVSCHLRMSSSEEPDHRFLPEVSDCSGCHTGIASFDQIRPANTPDYDGDGNTTEGLAGEVDTIRAALYAQIQTYAKTPLTFTNFPTPTATWILYDGSANPYWFIDANKNGVKDVTDTTGYNKMDAKLKKATYNYNQAVKEPHGYIHNNKYILQVMIDSIQDLGGNVTAYTRP